MYEIKYTTYLRPSLIIAYNGQEYFLSIFTFFQIVCQLNMKRVEKSHRNSLSI